MTEKRKRKVHLIAEPPVEKAVAAVVALGGYTAWVSIEVIGDFLRMRQHDAELVRFDAKDPNTRYALQPGLLKWKRGWEDAVIVKALSDAYDYDFIETARHDGVALFRAKKDPDSLWKMLDSSVPTSPTWALPRVAS